MEGGSEGLLLHTHWCHMTCKEGEKKASSMSNGVLGHPYDTPILLTTDVTLSSWSAKVLLD